MISIVRYVTCKIILQGYYICRRTVITQAKLTLYLTEVDYTIITSQIMVLRIGVLVGQMLAKKCSTSSQKTDKVILHSMSLCIIFYLRKERI